jgi:hypothetical protein
VSDLPGRVWSDEELSERLRADPRLLHFADLREYVVKNARSNLGLVIFFTKNQLQQLAVVDASLRTLANFSVGVARNEDAGEIQHLATRLFNSCAASISLLLEGYYQGSLILQRDVLETGFLLDYFWSAPAATSKWRMASAKERKTEYSPRQVRIELENVDRVNRGPIYEAFCEHAAHPTPLKKLTTIRGAEMVGPAFDQKKLFGCLGELARDVPYFAVVTGSILVQYSPALSSDLDAYKDFLRPWIEAGLGLRLHRFDRSDMATWAKALWEK